MAGRNVNIYLQEDIYQQVRQRAGVRQISRFINDILTEKLEQEQKKDKEKFRQQLIADYQDATQDKELNKELTDWDRAINDGLKKDE